MNSPFHEMAEFFQHMDESMCHPNGINFDKIKKMGGVEFKGSVDPTDF